MCIASFAGLSMSLVVVSVEMLREASRFWASSRASLVTLSPSWNRSIRGFGMGGVNGGWFLVVGMLVVWCFICGVGFPTCGMVAVRALWSMYVVLLTY